MESVKSHKGLSATQLKIIAILAMVCDHVAWGFVEMFSVQGQVMHVIGRLTIPIMCFFIAEGYRKTSNLSKYIGRMGVFALVAMIPFYAFFGEEYGYRQNIIFDFLLALLVLTVVDSKKLKKWQKLLFVIGLAAVSAFVGGWPILPMFFVLIFYYGKTFRQKALMIFATVVLLEIFLITVITLNSRYHFMSYDWVWYQWLYFFGFLLALPLLYFYNGEKGKYPIGRYFFYLFYPAHFCILYAIKMLMQNNFFNVYFGLHLIALMAVAALTIRLVMSRPSYAQIASIVVGFAGIFYTLGFLMEIISSDINLAYAGVVLEYIGECIVFLGFLWFMSYFCHRKIHPLVYCLATMFSIFTLYILITSMQTHYFYSSIEIVQNGPFTRLALSYNWGFYLFDAYIFVVLLAAIIMGIQSLKDCVGIERKRIIIILSSMLCPFFAFLLKLSGLTGGYEFSAFGVLGAIFCLYKAIISYGYLDSIQLAGENALHKVRTGVLVFDYRYKVTYLNDYIQVIFPELSLDYDVRNTKDIVSLLTKHNLSIVRDKRHYDLELIPLEESGYIQGYMLSSHDVTEHYEHLLEAERFAHTDSLTGLYNRMWFRSCFKDFREQGGIGSLLMFDLDNFKGVNDTLGHGSGDQVLIILANTIKEVAGTEHIPCRLGGDEFCLFLKNIIDTATIGSICHKLISNFSLNLEKAGFAGITSISIGISTVGRSVSIDSEEDFNTAYHCADKAMYTAKTSGKATYRFYVKSEE